MNSGLHVAHVVLSLDVGGLERNVINQVREGQKLGQVVSIVCVERPGVLAPQAKALNASVHCLDKKPGLRPGTILRMRKAIRELQPDVVHSHQIGALLYAGPAAASLRVPLIVHTEHGKPNYQGSRKTRWLGRIAGSFAKRFYCLTNDMADAVAQHRVAPRSKIRVIENGIALDDYMTPSDSSSLRKALGIPVAAPVIGTVGRLHEVKRQDLLIRAVRQVRARGVNAHLLVVGDGPRREELVGLAQEQGIGKTVHFAGYQQATAPFLHMMNCFALTSRSEGMPQSLLEACVAGVPVVASRVGGIPEIIGHERTGLLFESGDEAGLTEAILRVLSKPGESRQLATAARNCVLARFSVSRMAGDYQQEFLHLLGRPNLCVGDRQTQLNLNPPCK